MGPTASGKSSWAHEQAKKYHGSIVNIDSIQFYKDLLIGAAAPTEEQKKEVPYYLYSYVQAPEEMTAGEYLKNFYKLVESDIRFPLFIVGGTGFYIQALEKGMFDVEPIPAEFRENIEAELKREGVEKLYAELKQKDPQSKIHINDHYRLVRAIEIIRYTGKIPSQLKAQPEVNKNEFPFPYIKIGFDFEKADYIPRVNERSKNMIRDGIVDETKACLARGLRDWAPLHSVGYKECLQFIEESQSLDWLLEAINQSTLRLIKKQKTWFKRDHTILWSNQQQELEQFLS